MPGTSQQNGHAEQKFAMLFDRVRSVLNGGNFIDSWRHILWTKAANAAALLKSSIVKTGNEMSAFQIFGKGETKTILSSLQKFREKCIMTKQEK